MTSKIEVSHKTIIFTVLFLMSLWILWQIREILFLVFISFILMSALRPWVDRLTRLHVPRIVAILLIYILVFGIFGLSLASTFPTLVVQSTRFFQEFPVFVVKVLPYWNIDINAFTQQIAPISENIFRVTIGVFSNIITTLTILVFTFYFLLERRHAENFFINSMGEEAASHVIEIFKTIEGRLSAWLHGQFLLMLVIGVFVYIGLLLLHMDFALPLAIIAGILEIVPIIGPIVSAVPAVLVALASSPLLAVSVVALYFIVQQFENNLIVPFVMRRSVGLSPLVTIFSLMVGGKLMGILGAVLAIPFVLVLQVLTRAYFFRQPKK